LSVGADDFYFLLSLCQFSQDIGEWPENQILIPDWAYFHCPGATLVHTNRQIYWVPANQFSPSAGTTLIKERNLVEKKSQWMNMKTIPK